MIANRNCTPQRLPGGLPWLGHAVEFRQNPVAFLLRGYERCGDAFTFKMAGSDIVALIGPEAHQAFFRGDAEKKLSAREAYQFMVPIFGKEVAYAVSRERMDEQIKLLLPALNERRLRSYVSFIRDEVRSFCDRLGDEGELQLPELTKELTLYIVGRCLVGRNFRGDMSRKFAELYHDLEGGINLLAFFYPNLPLPSFRRRDRARQRMVELITAIVQERRQRGCEEADFLQTLMTARYADGSALSDDNITGLILTILFAGHHTTAVQMAWTGVELMRHPHYLERVMVEQQDLLPAGAELDFDKLKQMPVLERGMREAERLHPPVVVLMRRVVSEFRFRNHVVPAGSMAMVSPGASHRLGEVFSQPDRFDPDRFAAGREEDKRAKCSTITFGGGKHGCVGGGFAYLVVKAVWSLLWERFDWELLDQDAEADYGTFVVGPKSPCRVRYTCKKSGRSARLAMTAATVG